MEFDKENDAPYLRPESKEKLTEENLSKLGSDKKPKSKASRQS